MARSYLQLEEFKRRVIAGEFVCGKDSAPAVEVAFIADAAIDVDKRQATFVISDATVDRVRDVLFPEGCDSRNYKRNPVFLAFHEYDDFPIGRCVVMPWLEEEQLKATFKFHTAEKSDKAEKAWAQVRDEDMRAVSVGFVPIKWSYNETRGGIDFEEWELIEVSLVPVPCNPNALTDGKSLAAALAYVKDFRARTAPNPGATVSITKQTARLTLTGTKTQLEKAIASLESAELHGAELVRSSGTAENDEQGQALHDQMADHAKAIGEHVKTLKGLHKDFGDTHKSMEKCAKDFTDSTAQAQDHVKALGAMVDAMGDALQGDDKKAFAELVAKAMKAGITKGATDKLSQAHMKDVTAIAKAANSMISRHHDAQGQVGGETTDDTSGGEGDGSGKTAKPAGAKTTTEPTTTTEPEAPKTMREAAERIAKELNDGTTPEEVLAQWNADAVAQARGKLDAGPTNAGPTTTQQA